MRILSVCGEPDCSAYYLRVTNIGRLLSSLGHRVDYIHYPLAPGILNKNFVKREFIDEIGSTHYFLSSSRYLIPIKHLNFLLNNRYDLVYGNATPYCFVSLLGKLIKVPLILDFHGDGFEEFLISNPFQYSPSYLLKYFQNIIINLSSIKFSNKIVCVSKKMIHYIHQKKVPLEKIYYVPNGVDLNFFNNVSEKEREKLREDLKIEDKQIFAYIGGFQKWQGVENLIHAAEHIHDENLVFLFVGGNIQYKKRNIVCIPNVPRHEIIKYHSIADIFVLPRFKSTATEIAAPTKFAEYASMGKPILTTNVGDAAELVRKYHCGYVIDGYDSESLVEGIQTIREIPDSLLSKMGDNSRTLAESEFDWNKIKTNLFKMID